MDPGFTEFQVIIGVSVILGLAFLALVFEHMRSKEASLREFNIELQVRQEERERNKPFEAVEWLQHLLGAKQATLRVSRKGAEPAKRREAADAPPGAVSAKGFRVDPASAPSAGAPAPQTDHSVPGQVLPGQTAQSSRFAPPIERRSWQKESAAGDKPVEHAPVEKTATERPGTQRQGLEKPGVEAAEPVLAARSRSPFDLAKPIQSKPIDVPSIASVTRANGFETNPVPNTPMAERDPQVAANGLPPVTDSPVTDLVAVDSEVRARSHSRLTERLQHPDEQRTRAASSLLSTLPMPAWLRKEQEEKAAARSRREPLQAADAQIFESKPQVVALAPESVTSEPVATETAANQTAAPEIASRASEPVHAASPKKPESFWSYRGLLDRVVAATGERRNSAPEPAAAAEIAAGKTAAVDVAEVLVNPEAAVEVETAREAAPEVVLVEVTESARQISAISSSPAPSSGPVSFVEGSFVEASFAEAEPSMEIATVTMEVPEHPMLDVIEPETAGAQETAIEQETPIAQETVAEQEALAEPQPFVADLHDSEPVLLLVEEDTPLPAPDGSTTALLESDPAQAAEPEVAALEVTEPVADYQQLPEGVETSSLFLVSPQPEVEPEPVEPAGTISNEEVAVEPARGEPQFAESVLADEPELEALIPEVVNALHPLELPVGFHHRQVLDDLLKSTAVVNGVVVVIGINDYSHHSERMGRTGMKEWMASVETMIRSLLTEKDFGCRSSEDEFVLVFPGETGTAAQRRLNAISERLWSFQLRSLGAFSVIFCWGAVEIQGETLADATASASERMYQTKRNRKGASMESGRPRKAVNL